MEITGKIIVAMPEVGGTSAKGNAWKKREYVLETMETYPKRYFSTSSATVSTSFPFRWVRS